MDPAEAEDRRRLLGGCFEYVLLNPDLNPDLDSDRACLLREHYRQALIGFREWAGVKDNWLHAFMILHHDLVPWTLHLFIDITIDKIVRVWSTLHVRGTRFMVRAMSELQKDELVKTYEYIYDFELAESMASNSTRLDWGVTNSAAKKHRGVFCASKFRSSLYPTIPLNTHTNPG